MKKFTKCRFSKLLCFGLVLFCCLSQYAGSGTELNLIIMSNNMDDKEPFLIDDFSNTTRKSVLGNQWRTFSDGVMGGRSTATSGYETLKGRPSLRLQGSVSLENNGGFIQVALSLVKGGDYFDACKFKGVRLWVLGNGETYHVHLRSNQTRRPWQYYGAPFKTNGDWQKIDIPFKNFQPENLGEQLDTRRLSRIAVVAIKKNLEADIAVARFEIYQ